VQIRVPEDLKLLGVLKRTFTAIKVREANLSVYLIYKFLNREVNDCSNCTICIW